MQNIVTFYSINKLKVKNFANTFAIRDQSSLKLLNGFQGSSMHEKIEREQNSYYRPFNQKMFRGVLGTLYTIGRYEGITALYSGLGTYLVRMQSTNYHITILYFKGTASRKITGVKSGINR